MRTEQLDAVVVGSGPNGLAAAVVLTAAGLRVQLYEAADTFGGGARSAELTLPGVVSDVCSAVHPLALASPFFRAFDLAAHGVRFAVPELSFAHPLDGGDAALAWRDLERTCAGLGCDGPAWRRLFAPLVARWAAVAELALSDLRSLPRSPALALRLALRVAEQGSPAWQCRWHGARADALLTGAAAHAIAPPRALGPSGAG
ncbi:MAG: phytoene desaturase family protein, partial [Sciscionella sp.]